MSQYNNNAIARLPDATAAFIKAGQLLPSTESLLDLLIGAIAVHFGYLITSLRIDLDLAVGSLHVLAEDSSTTARASGEDITTSNDNDEFRDALMKHIFARYAPPSHPHQQQQLEQPQGVTASQQQQLLYHRVLRARPWPHDSTDGDTAETATPSYGSAESNRRNTKAARRIRDREKASSVNVSALRNVAYIQHSRDFDHLLCAAVLSNAVIVKTHIGALVADADNGLRHTITAAKEGTKEQQQQQQQQQRKFLRIDIRGLFQRVPVRYNVLARGGGMAAHGGAPPTTTIGGGSRATYAPFTRLIYSYAQALEHCTVTVSLGAGMQHIHRPANARAEKTIQAFFPHVLHNWLLRERLDNRSSATLAAASDGNKDDNNDGNPIAQLSVVHMSVPHMDGPLLAPDDHHTSAPNEKENASERRRETMKQWNATRSVVSELCTVQAAPGIGRRTNKDIQEEQRKNENERSYAAPTTSSSSATVTCVSSRANGPLMSATSARRLGYLHALPGAMIAKLFPPQVIVINMATPSGHCSSSLLVPAWMELYDAVAVSNLESSCKALPIFVECVVATPPPSVTSRSRSVNAYHRTTDRPATGGTASVSLRHLVACLASLGILGKRYLTKTGVCLPQQQHAGLSSSSATAVAEFEALDTANARERRSQAAATAAQAANISNVLSTLEHTFSVGEALTSTVKPTTSSSFTSLLRKESELTSAAERNVLKRPMPQRTIFKPQAHRHLLLEQQQQHKHQGSSDQQQQQQTSLFRAFKAMQNKIPTNKTQQQRRLSAKTDGWELHSVMRPKQPVALEFPTEYLGERMSRSEVHSCCVVGQWDRKFVVAVVPVSENDAPSGVRSMPSCARGTRLDYFHGCNKNAKKSSPSDFPTKTSASSLPASDRRYRLCCYDQHAVHERIRLEYFLRNLRTQYTTSSQPKNMQKLYQAAADPARSPSSEAVRHPSMLSTDEIAKVLIGSPCVEIAVPTEYFPLVSACNRDLIEWEWLVTLSSPSLFHKAGSLLVYSHPVITIEKVTCELSAASDLLEFLDALADARGIATATTSSSSSSLGSGNYKAQGYGVEGTTTAAAASATLLPPAAYRFAVSRSCRGAIMFGMALSHNSCVRLVEGLQYVVQYGVCSHGRPSNTHLLDVC